MCKARTVLCSLSLVTVPTVASSAASPPCLFLFCPHSLYSGLAFLRPTSGPLHMIFPLLQIVGSLSPHFLQGSAQVALYQWDLLWSPRSFEAQHSLLPHPAYPQSWSPSDILFVYVLSCVVFLPPLLLSLLMEAPQGQGLCYFCSWVCPQCLKQFLAHIRWLT